MEKVVELRRMIESCVDFCHTAGLFGRGWLRNEFLKLVEFVIIIFVWR